MRLIKNKAFILITITLLILIAMGISGSRGGRFAWFNNIISVPLSPVQKFFSFAGQKVEGSVSLFNDAKNVKDENEKLKAEIDRLEKEKMDLLRFKDENQVLKEALNLKNQYSDYDFIGAYVIAKDAGNWFNVFTIDRGSKDGIFIGQKSDSAYYPVITSKGLVGKIIGTDVFSSKVLSVIDAGSSVSARISKTRDLVVVRGSLSLKEQGLCRMDLIPADAEISFGDTIETSGIGGIFPPGLLIGKVKEVRQSSNELTRYAIIEPAVDFKRLEQVFVLKSKNPTTGSVGK